MKWFRLYREILDDPKMMALDDKEFRVWIGLLCLGSRDDCWGNIPWTLQEISRLLRQDIRSTSRAFDRLKELKMVEQNHNGFLIVNWEKRQFKSDNVTERVKRFRNVTRNVACNVLDTDTDTDTENTPPIISPPLVEEKTKKKKYGEFENVLLTDAEIAKLTLKFGTSLSEKIESLSGYIASKGKKYKSHYATILVWSRKEPQDEYAKFLAGHKDDGPEV